VSLKLKDKGMVFIVGKSGSGKSTLLNLLGLLDDVTYGKIYYRNSNISKLNQKNKDQLRSHNISFIFQDYHLLDTHNVIENIELGLRFQGFSEDEIKRISSDSLNAVGLSEYKDRKIESLSGGEKQRIAIARAIAKQTEVILCDEPTGNLDEENTLIVMDKLRELANDRLVVVVTHQTNLYNKYANEVIRLDEGKIVEHII
jgi:ABC-type lipoprotein export system ATPase subunit